MNDKENTHITSPPSGGASNALNALVYPVPAKFVGIVVAVIAVGLAGFHLYTGAFGVFTALIQRSLHLSFMMTLIFLTVSIRGQKNKTEDGGYKVPVYDLVLAGLAALPGIYMTLNYQVIAERGGLATDFELLLGIVLTVLLIESVRRVVGNALAIICTVALLYAHFGNFLPGILAHRGYSVGRIAYQMYLTQSGIMGVPLGVCATVIALFILFAAFLDRSGGSKYFVDFARLTTARSVGGPAKAAVVSSGLLGMLSGSTVANVVTTGSLTIPLMMRSGYTRNFAAAVVAVASSGGQLAPPIMGAAAFQMAETIGIPYSEVALAAAIPALLFYFSQFAIVHFEALRLGLKTGLDKDAPRMNEVSKGIHLFLPIALLIGLLIAGYSAMYVGFWTIVGTVIISFVRRETWLDVKKFFWSLFDGTMNMLPVTVACASAGIVIGAVTITGLPLKLSAMLIAVAGGSKFILLVLTMCASLILGMGLPTAPAYILLAALVAPALEMSGVPAIAAHMFIFYFGIISAITPPVALAAYAAAGIAKTDPNKTGFTACFIGITTYIVPYMFVYGPELVAIGTPMTIIKALITALIGVYSLAIAVVGYWKRPCFVWERALFAVSSILLVYPDWRGNALGGVLLMIAGFSQWKDSKKITAAPEPVGS